MKKHSFAGGGEFELSDEAKASGLSMGRNSRISDEDRAAAIAETTGAGSKDFKRLTDKDAADLMGREVNMPAAVAIPVPAPRRNAPTPPPDMASDQISRNAPAPKSGNQNDYSMNEQEGSGGGQAARAPSRGDYSRNGPIGDLVDIVTASKGKAVAAKDATMPAPVGVFKSLQNTLVDRLMGKESRRRKLAGEAPIKNTPYKKGGAVKTTSRGDGIAQRGKTKGRFV